MRKAILTFACLLALASPSMAQDRTRISGGTTLPANCQPRDLFYKTAATIGLYECKVANSWTLNETGSGGGGSGTVTEVDTTSPITGGPVTSIGTIACATCVISASALTSGQLVLGAGSQATAVGNLSGAVTTSGTAVTSLAAQYTVRTCIETIGDPDSSSPVLVDGNDAPAGCANDTGVDWTITGVGCWANAGSPTITPILTGGTSTSILTGALTCGTASWAAGTVNGSPVVHSFSGGATCSSTPCTVDNNITSAGGTARFIRIKITGTLPSS